MPIRKLPPLLVNQIAAGEVVERPASVVKELVENSLDAGATQIHVSIEDGGRQLIRISDNGCGIAPDELPLAVAAHATSKLQSAEQLSRISTLGFRGEALASIGSVSRLRIFSRATGVDPQGVLTLADAGAVVEMTGEEVSPVAPASGGAGTVVEVRDLFFNTPARRRFMRGAPTEFGQIADTLARIAMNHPATGFTLEHHGRKTLELPPGQTRRERCVAILGNELDEALLEATDVRRVLDPANPEEAWLAKVWVLAGLPAIARPTAKFQYLCVNGRPVRDRGLSHALKEAYRGLMPPEKQPVAVLMVDVDPQAVDVNVHPAKSEVRFRDPAMIHGLVLAVLRQRLLGADLTPAAGLQVAAAKLDTRFEPALGAEPSSSSATWDLRPAGQGSQLPLTLDALRSATAEATQPTQQFVEYFRQMDPRLRGEVYQQVRQVIEEVDPALAQSAAPARSPEILQVHKSYLVTQDERGILIVDQHALHERVMFEELSKRVLGSGKLESQRLLMPVILKASAKRLALLEGISPLLERLGIEVEAMGPGTLAVQAFSSFLFDRKVDPAEFLESLFERVEEGQIEVTGSTATEAALHQVLDMMACKAAVKAGDQMTPAELSALLQKREQIERSSNCPHGRPTTVRLSLRDLEKQFKRT